MGGCTQQQQQDPSNDLKASACQPKDVNVFDPELDHEVDPTPGVTTDGT
jgi:hypothetical protein